MLVLKCFGVCLCVYVCFDDCIVFVYDFEVVNYDDDVSKYGKCCCFSCYGFVNCN